MKRRIQFLADKIKEMVKRNGGKVRSCVALYLLSALSQDIEEACTPEYGLCTFHAVDGFEMIREIEESPCQPS